MLIIDQKGSLRTSDEYGAIYLEPGSYNIENLPYCVKISKIREIIYGPECLCTSKIIWIGAICSIDQAIPKPRSESLADI